MKHFLHILLFVFSFFANSQNITITESSGWLESAYIKWNPVSGAESYNVYYTGNGLIDQQIDTQLIRSYGAYYRADVLGLSAGNYTLKIVPVINGTEGSPTISNTLQVLPQDRNGFAHANGKIPGAYNLDGTLKANAVVLYITENTKNTISLDVEGATTNPCVGVQNILDGFKKGDDNRPLCIRLIGNITDLDYMISGDLVIENENNQDGSITFEGVGDDATVNGWGIRIKRGSNIEIRNLGFMLTDANEGDNVGSQQDNEYIWVHNCDMFYGDSGGDADQSKGDGALDCKKSTYVTFSYNHYWDTGKTNLLGLNENSNSELYATYHHNWFDHSDSRHPRVRTFSAHIYNNYFDGIAKYGSGSTEGSSLFVEGNYFRNCKYPMLISQQGTDVYNGSSGTFSGEDGGMIKAYDNYIIGETRYVTYDPTNYPVQFDAYEASTRSETLGANITSSQGNNTYNNFDTDPTLYVNGLSVESPNDAKNTVMQYSGRVNGGDINWVFNNAVDDTDYDVNQGLLNLLTSYTTNLVSVQGENNTNGNQTLNIPDNNHQAVDEGNPITDMIFTWGGDANGATVSGLPDSGIDYSIDTNQQTVTVFGIPTNNVSFSITTTGSTGSSVTGNGSIAINGIPTGDEIHNFTESQLNSSYYTFTGANMNSTPGNTTYDGLTLTERMKVESSTNIAYTTSSETNLTLVFDPGFNGDIRLDGISHSASNGVLTIPNIPSGNHNITKDDTTNLYYIKSESTSLSVNDNFHLADLKLYPNPVENILNIQVEQNVIKHISIISLKGEIVESFEENITNHIDLSNLSSGFYFIKIGTDLGSIYKKIFKN